MRGLQSGSPKLPPLLPSVHNLRRLFKELSIPLVIYLDSAHFTVWWVTDLTLPSPLWSPGPFHLQQAALALFQSRQMEGGTGGLQPFKEPQSPTPSTLAGSGVV